MGLAADASLADEVKTARARLLQGHQLFRQRYGTDHPRTQAGVVNLAVLAEAAGNPMEAAARTLHLGRLARSLGEEHPRCAWPPPGR